MKREIKKTEIDDNKYLFSQLSGISDVCATGLYNGSVDEDCTFSEFLNKMTSSNGLLYKPFTIASEVLKEKNPYLSSYYGDLADNIYNMNISYQRTTIQYYITKSLLDAFHTMAGLIANEFETLSDRVINILKAKGSQLANILAISFYSSIDPDIIYRAMITIIGKEKLYEYHTAYLEGKKSDEYRQMVEYISTPYIQTFANAATAKVADCVFETLYESLIGDLDSADFNIILAYLSPIIVSYRDDVLQSMSRAMFEIISNRLCIYVQKALGELEEK